nr:MAG TPA: Helicase of the snf2 rad54 family [Caudoviricetes sp.]
MLKYDDFINSKSKTFENMGIDVDRNSLNPNMFEFQKDIVRWALKKGRAAIFAECGLGKTLMQLSWADEIHKHTGGKILILAPLAVAPQTKEEGEKFGISVNICESQDDVVDGINITNYEKIDKFTGNSFQAVVLDESSILKSFTSSTRNKLIDNFSKVPFRLACTATPAPNDHMELGNHSEFLGVMTRAEMLSMYFVHDGGNTAKWRLKGHAEDVFWNWMASWAVFIDNPKNLDYEVNGYDLPKLNINEIIVDGDEVTSETLTLTQRRQARKDSMELRCKAAADLVNSSDEQWLVWCDLNDESAMLKNLIDNAVEIKGSDKATHKTGSMLNFSDGLIKCLVTKPSIAGFGMNWQQCHNMIFVGLSDSYEKYYQAVRRCYRFGQKNEVNVYIIISAKEGAVKANIERKQEDAKKMQDAMIKLTKEVTKKELQVTTRIMTEYVPKVKMMLPDWKEMRQIC